ncbi:MAG: hypothetical protein ISP55_02960 [Flavobacteriales bacterium]|nr:hypothetical protein [Flavobacteriales bacterium]
MRRLLPLLFLACLPFNSCRDTPGVIPFVEVNVDLNLALPAYNSLNFPGNWLYISGGSRGLIVYRYTLDEFVVLDRHATFDVGAGCQCTVAEDGYTILDPCSDSQWYIFDGSFIQGPTTAPLERYTTTWIPPVLSIQN